MAYIFKKLQIQQPSTLAEVVGLDLAAGKDFDLGLAEEDRRFEALGCMG